jgi:SNF2 family DNA or RNA helicase
MPFEPYAHQIEALKRMKGKDAFALLMGMRTGKTKVTIDDWQQTSDMRNRAALLVVAPAGTYRVWETELQKHMEPEYYERAMIRTWDSRQGTRSISDVVMSMDRTRPQVLITNVEAFSTSDVIRHACADFLQRSPQSVIACDESTTIKNENSNRSKTLRIIRPMALKARILSGMPTPRSPLDIWAQFEFLKPGLLGFVSYKAFEDRYAVVRHMKVGGRYSIRVPVRYKDTVEELWRKLAPHSYRKRLEECADVPKKLYVIREVELTSEQERMYREMEKNATVEISVGVHMTATMSVTRALRMHQLCCGWATDEEYNVVPVSEKRTRAVLDLLSDHDGKAIVWCSYGRDLTKVREAIEWEFGPQHVASFWGGNAQIREAESNRFKTDPSCRVMVATPASGGRGRDWSEANLIAYYSNTDNLEHRDQSEERASAVMRSDRVTIVDFAARDTIEWKIIYAMRKKMDLATVVMGDPPREWVV